MKNTLYILGLGYLVVCLTGCIGFLKPAAQHDINANPRVLSNYTGHKARISFTDFETTAAKANSQISLGLREIFSNALVSSNHFYLANRQLQESPETKPADLIISVAIVEFEPQASGGRSGIGGGGGTISGALGGLLGASLNNARLSLDIRIIDAATSQTVAKTMRLRGQAADSSSMNNGSLFGNCPQGKGLCIYKHTPMEKAISICIAEAVRYIIQNIPSAYYKY